MAQTEVIIVSGSSFLKRHSPRKEKSSALLNLSSSQLIEESHWDASAVGLLPNLFINHSEDECLLQLRKCKQTLLMEMGEDLHELDFRSSIDPYFFIELIESN